MTLGFIKPISGDLALRWARPGSDADDDGLPQNQVVFDSRSQAVFGAYVSGVYGPASMPGSWTRVVTWPSLGYVPVTTLIYYQNVTDWIEQGPLDFSWSSVGNSGVAVGEDGIYMKAPSGSSVAAFALYYIVHRMPAF